MPSAKATQLYLQASSWNIEPFKNKFPLEVVKSLWAGIMTWRRWRKFVEITDGITLTDYWISRIHYLTLELMGHAGILHQMALYLCFPDLSIEDNLHSIFRGGASNLPITSANLTIQDFLCRMNKVMQITDTENALHKISGNTLQSSKKQKLTYALSANEPSTFVVLAVYNKPETYKEFLKDLMSACRKGDEDSKHVMEKLTPHLVKSLKKVKQ